MAIVTIMPETGGYRIYVTQGDTIKQTTWKPYRADANKAAQIMANYYRDENGQSATIKWDND